MLCLACFADTVSVHMIDLGGDVTGSGISKLVFTILFAVATEHVIRDGWPSEADRKRRGRYRGGKDAV